MAGTINPQDIANAKVDIEDIGESVNEAKVITPRYGDSYKSIPLVSAEAESKIAEFQQAIDTIVIDDGVPAVVVSTASDQNQQEINDFGGYAKYKDGRIYTKNQYVMLDNGDVVKAVDDGVTNDPNVDMTGWIKVNSASQIIDASGENQQEINNIALDPNLAPLGWTQKDFNDQFVDVRKFIKKDLSNATTGLQAAIEAAYGGTLLIPIPLVLLDSMYIEKGLNIVGTQSSVESYALDTKRLDFSDLASGKNAFNIAKSGKITGFKMSNLYLRGAKSEGIAIDTGKDINSSLVDFTFENITINNFSKALRQTYSWAGLFNRVRMQGCTNGVDYDSQCNAIVHNATSIVTIDNVALRHSNAEGIQYNGCNISNLSKTNGAPITFFQSTATFINPYLENVDNEYSMDVGGTTEDPSIASSVVIVAPKKLGKNIRTGTRHNHVEIIGTDKDNVSVIGVNIARETRATVTGKNAVNKINKVLDILKPGEIRNFQAHGSSVLTYAAKRGYFLISNSSATSGIRLASGTLEIGKTYTLSLAVRSSTVAPTFFALAGQGVTSTIELTANTDPVRIQTFSFVASSANLNLWFTGEIEFYGFKIQEGNLTSFDPPFQIQPPRQAGVFESLSEPIGVTNWVLGDKIINRGSGDVLHWEATSATTLKTISRVIGLTSASTTAQIVSAMQAAGIAT